MTVGREGFFGQGEREGAKNIKYKFRFSLTCKASASTGNVQ